MPHAWKQAVGPNRTRQKELIIKDLLNNSLDKTIGIFQLFVVVVPNLEAFPNFLLFARDTIQHKDQLHFLYKYNSTN